MEAAAAKDAAQDPQHQNEIELAQLQAAESPDKLIRGASIAVEGPWKRDVASAAAPAKSILRLKN